MAAEKEFLWNPSCFLDANPERFYAIVVLNQPIRTHPDLVSRLWANALIRITVDGGTNRWLHFIETHSAHNLPLPDCITGDFDSLKDRSRKYFEEKSVPFVCTPDQDATDFTKSLKQLMLLVNQQHLNLHHIIVLVTNSGRVDHIMANLETLHSARDITGSISVILMSSNSLTWLLPQGNHTIHIPEEPVRQSYSVGLIPMMGPTKVATSGLKWNLDNDKLAFGELVSTSNTYDGNTVKISCDKNLIWTMQFTAEDE